jgi:hypothetical protein
MITISAIFAAYIITAVLVNGNIFYGFRRWFKTWTPWLYKGDPLRHMIDCRMCAGFWISLVVTLATGLPLWAFFIIYGASYFLATLER